MLDLGYRGHGDMDAIRDWLNSPLVETAETWGTSAEAQAGAAAMEALGGRVGTDKR